MANVVVSHSRAFWRIWLLGFWLLVVASFLAVIFGISAYLAYRREGLKRE
jgi:hypothetical protein